jgi:hypothetical protein
MFLATSADIAIYGWSAGGGKTWAILMEPVRHIGNGDFGGVIFRRESPQIFPLLGASSKLQPAQWVFPSGAKLTMSHLQLENDVFNWQGAQIPFIAFDELTHFTRKQFFYMLSRNRSTCGVRPYIRATTNPDPDSWVREMIDWWIDEDGYAIRERSGIIRWFVVINDTVRWADSPDELRAPYGEDCSPKSFTFIASSIYDNKILLEADPGYLANLKAQSLEQQQRLLHRNWKFKNEGRAGEACPPEAPEAQAAGAGHGARCSGDGPQCDLHQRQRRMRDHRAGEGSGRAGLSDRRLQRRSEP